MQVKCPHCRFKYNETLTPATTEVLSVCPRCGHSFSFEVTEDDIREEQTPPPVPTSSQEMPEAQDVDVPPVPEYASVQPAGADVTNSHEPTATVTTASNVVAQSDVKTDDERHSPLNNRDRAPYSPQKNFSPQPETRGGSTSLSTLLLFIIISMLGASLIYGMSKIFGKDDKEVLNENITADTEPSAMTITSTGNSTFRFEGDIIGTKKRLPIVMNLTKRGNKIEGNYYYVMRGSDTQLSLHGKVEESGKVTMREYDMEGNHTGDFHGTLYADGTFKGTFKSGNKKRFRFELSMT